MKAFLVTLVLLGLAACSTFNDKCQAPPGGGCIPGTGICIKCP